MDSLRYWVTEMHVDGFRFDLAVDARRASCTRSTGCRRSSTSSSRTRSCRQVKLIAEPWDVGEGGYQVGNFPPLWSEWNGKYRDTVRDYWRGERPDAGRVRLPAHRLEPTSTRTTARRPYASDQLRHRPRRLHARRPRRRTTTSTTRPTARTTTTARRTTARGTAASRARPTTREINELRSRQQRNFLATLLLSQGVPMLLGGDEIGRTQRRQQQRLLPGQRDLLVRLGARRRRSCSPSRSG